jgi:hypothetical protein
MTRNFVLMITKINAKQLENDISNARKRLTGLLLGPIDPQILFYTKSSILQNL